MKKKIELKKRDSAALVARRKRMRALSKKRRGGYELVRSAS